MKITKNILHLIGFGMMGNGFWMISSAFGWFQNIPADMSATGTPNLHLIHDVGIAYIIFGYGLEWCIRNLTISRPVYIGVMTFSVGHAVGHVIEIINGQLPISHWWIDFPLVFLPGILLAVVAIPSVWDRLLAFEDNNL